MVAILTRPQRVKNFTITSIDLVSGSAVTPTPLRSRSPMLRVMLSFPLTRGDPVLVQVMCPPAALIRCFSMLFSGLWSWVRRTTLPTRHMTALLSPTWPITNSLLCRSKPTVAVVPDVTWPSAADEKQQKSKIEQTECLMAPSHYLKQWWLLISEVLWHLHCSCESNFTVSAQDIILYDEFENYTFKLQYCHIWWSLPGANELTHCGLMMPYGNTDLD